MNEWLSVGLLAILLVGLAAIRTAQTLLKGVQRVPKENGEGELAEPMPIALLQVRAIWSIVVIMVAGITMYLVIPQGGIEELFVERALRLRFTLLLIISFGLIAWIMAPLNRKGKWADLLDERDDLVLRRATHFQLVGVMMLVVVWTMALTEVYWEAGQIPISMLTLLFWSCMIMLFLARSVGIIVGYWWLDRYGN